MIAWKELFIFLPYRIVTTCFEALKNILSQQTCYLKYTRLGRTRGGHQKSNKPNFPSVDMHMADFADPIYSPGSV